MKALNKYNVLLDGEIGLPSLGLQIEEHECLHCGRMMRFPVRSCSVDWEKVAEEYRRAGNEMAKSFDQMVKDIDVMYPDNPAREYISNAWKAAIGEWEKDF